MQADPFLTPFARDTFYRKYALTSSETWAEKARRIVEGVAGRNNVFRAPLMSEKDLEFLREAIANMWFLPGGRYIYYAGRRKRFWNNCLLLALEEDTREAWATLAHESMASLMTGAGIGVDYSKARPNGHLLGGTGGTASGPIALMKALNEIGRQVMQGGSRRSALYASLNWQHADIEDFLTAKDWHTMPTGIDGVTVADLKAADFNAPAPLDMTNISVNYDDDFLERIRRGDYPATFVANVYQALKTSEPGFSFNFGPHAGETLRNACTEVTSRDSSDICNLGSLNLARIPDIDTFAKVAEVATRFLIAGTIRAEVPYEKVAEIREKNRRLGLGLMGVHEFLLQRGSRYEMTDELRRWMDVYRNVSDFTAAEHCDRFYLSHPAGKRAIAPTGTISILAGPTTSGIEPLFCQAYKRRYLVGSREWREEFVIDPVAEHLIENMGLAPEDIETSADLAQDPERRLAFQADMQEYVDHAISSTVNLPAWGTELNNENRVQGMVELIAKYAPRLRGLTFYADQSRGGQPLNPVPYTEAKRAQAILEESNQCKGGVCGI